jgi:hypothetical protein
VDHLAHKLQAHGLALAAALKHHAHPRARRAAHPADGVVDGHAARVLALDGHELVAGAHPRTRRGRTRDGRDDREPLAAGVDLHADAAKLARRVALQEAVLLGVEVGAVRVERAHHAADGAVDEAVFVHRVDVAVFDVGHHL